VSTHWGNGDVQDEDLYFALGNVQADRWDWFDGEQNTGAVVNNMDDYIHDTHPTDPNRVLMVVALTAEHGSTNGELRYVRLGDNIPPVATFTYSPGGGVAPLDVTFDPSGSSDEEGPITCSWDFDDDGTFEYSNVDPVVQNHTYTAPGNYTCNLLVTDNEGGQANQRVGPFNVAAAGMNPTADLQADRTTIRTGSNTEVNFDATGSTDDGSITQYEFDFTNDGTYDETNATGLASFIYAPVAGTQACKLQVTDDQGMTDTATVTITINDNQPPEVFLDCDTWFGDAPVDTILDASRSNDPDGTPLSFAWDLDGDGTYETGTGATPTQSFSLPNPGNQLVGVQVTDEDGSVLTVTGFITADDGTISYDEIEPNESPAAASQLPTISFHGFDASLGPGGYDGGSEDWFKFGNEGNMLFTINMSILEPSADLDLYLYSADGITELARSNKGAGENESITYFLGAGGEYYLRCINFNNVLSSYALSASQVYTIPPIANFEATPSSGTVPIQVLLDASTSHDNGGSAIILFEWDYNGDGAYDHSDVAPSHNYKYFRHGDWPVRLKVNNAAGAWATTSQVVGLAAGTWDESEDNDAYTEADTLVGSNPTFGDLGLSSGYGANDGDFVDWYQAVAMDTDVYTVQMHLNHAFGDLDIEMYEDDGTTLVGSSYGTGDVEEFQVSLAIGSTYYFKCISSGVGGSGYTLFMFSN
jgi:PKD repeat protein